MGSGARARSRSFKPRDNFAVEESHRASTSPPGETSGGGGAASLAAARLSFGHGASSDGIRGSGLGPAASVAGEPCRACRAAGASTSGTHRGGATGRSPPRMSSELARALAADAQVAVAIDHPHAVADDDEPGGDAQPRCTCGRGWNERVRRLSESIAQGLVAATVPATRGAHDATNERIGIGIGTGTAGGGGVGDSPTCDDDILLYDGSDEGRAREEAASVAETRGEEPGDSPTGDSQPGDSPGVIPCDACPSCDDACGVQNCATCGGPRGYRTGDVEALNGGSYRMAPPEEVAAAVDIATAAAANPRRTGWGRSVGAADDDALNPKLNLGTGGLLVAGDTKGKKRRESVPLTCCQVRRHRHEGSLWLVANGRVYDATLFMYDHPVGPAPMLRGSGRDNTEDMEMHSGAAQRAWRRLRIGHLVPCPAAGYGYFNPPPRESRCAIQ